MDERSPHCAWAVLHEQRKRQENQDAWVLAPAGTGWLLAVCDGMGGVRGGARASALACEALHEHADRIDCEDPAGALSDAILDANRRILKEAKADLSHAGMGTTMVCVFVRDRVVYLVWVGDSRAGLLSGGELRWKSVDHTRVQELVDMGLIPADQAEGHPYGHILSRAVGVSASLETQAEAPFELQEGERLMLCSDGVSGAATLAELRDAMQLETAHQAVAAMGDAVALHEGDDNATALVWLPDAPPEETQTPEPPTPTPEPPGMDRQEWVIAGILMFVTLIALAWVAAS
jgi:serine/threonine protein phosphatase PrpC